jgi:hypothetical protein
VGRSGRLFCFTLKPDCDHSDDNNCIYQRFLAKTTFVAFPRLHNARACMTENIEATNTRYRYLHVCYVFPVARATTAACVAGDGCWPVPR